MRKKCLSLMTMLFAMMLLFLVNVDAHAARKVNGVEYLRIVGINIVEVGNLTGDSLPRGVTYNEETNTLVLNNANLSLYNQYAVSGIQYKGARDLHIELYGINTMTGNAQNPNGCTCVENNIEYEDKNGDIYFSGTGTLRGKYVDGFFWQSWQGIMEGYGDIYIDGVTLESDGRGIITQLNNVTIRNAQIKIDNKVAMSEIPMGIVIGRAEDGKYYEGLLTVENSIIEIKNCYTALACNKYKFVNEYCYTGNTRAEKEVTQSQLFEKSNHGTVDRLVNYQNYVLLSNTKLSNVEPSTPQNPTVPAKWVKDKKGWWYRYSDGSYPKNKWEQIGGKYYYFNASGYLKTGWIKVGSIWYYANGSGVRQEGWKKLGGKWYYLTPGTGAMKTGWYQVKENWYYSNSGGVMQTGWIKVGKSWYYTNNNGVRQEGWKKLGGKWYYLTPGTGAMKTGWYQVEDNWYYSNSSGARQTGWLKIKNVWYYLASDGHRVANTWYTIKGKEYHFDENGKMSANCWVDGYYVDKSGAKTKR